MGTMRKILFYLLIPIVFVCIAESIIYYSASGLSNSEVFLCSLDNTYKIFLARPAINPYYAFRAINKNYSEFARVITHIYGFVVIIAPILTASAIIASFRAYIYDFWYSIKVSFKDKMFIIGDGRMIHSIAEKYADKYYVHYLMSNDVEDQVRIPYLQKKIKAFTVDYKNMPRSCKDAHIEKGACIVINFRNWFDSYTTITDCLEYLISKSGDEPTPVFMIDAPSTFTDIFDNLYRGLCMKLDRPTTTLSIKFINVDEVNAKAFFENPRLTEQPGNEHHIIFAGLGTYGKTFLEHLVTYMFSAGISGSIDVVDRNMDNNIQDLLYSSKNQNLENLYTVVEAAPDASYSVKLKSPSGDIDLNYYKASIGDLNFANIMSRIVDKHPISEYFLCVDNVSITLEYYRMLLVYLVNSNKTKIYFRLSEDQSSAFDAIKIASPEVDYLPDQFPELELFVERE